MTRGFSLANAKIGNDRDSKASASGVGDRDDTLDSLIFHSKQVFQSGLMSSIRGLGQLASGSSDDVSVLGEKYKLYIGYIAIENLPCFTSSGPILCYHVL